MRPVVPALVLLLLMVATPATFAASPNLIADPGFEGKSWQLGSWEVCEYTSEWTSDAHESATAAHLKTIKAGKDNRISALAISKVFAVQPGQEYLMALWYKTAGDNPGAAVSVVTFKDPFATAGWKTQQTSYRSFSLPPTTGWRLWTQRFRAPFGSVEGIVLPRVQAVGEMWVDDVSFVPTNTATLTLAPGAGNFVTLPDTRRYAGTIAAPGAAELQVYGEAEKPLATARGKQFDLRLTVPVGQRLQGVLVETEGRAVLATERFPSPPLVNFVFRNPSYRRTLYAGTNDRVSGLLQVNADSALLNGAKYASTVASVEPVPVLAPSKPAQHEQIVSEPLPPGEAPRKLALNVAVQVGTQKVAVQEPFNVVARAPSGTHEFTLAPEGQLLMDGKPFLARGFMGGNPTVYGPVAKAGYNVGMTFGDSVASATRFLDGCVPLNMFMVTGLPNSFVEKNDPEGLRAAIRQVRNHPALLGYYFPDEPSPSRKGSSPAEFARFYQIMVEEDPYHPVMTTLCDVELADDYQNCLDILLFDPYPITKVRRPLTMVSDWMLRARELTGNRKAIWFVPQTFGGDVVQGCPQSYSWVTPTPEQERCMIYLGLATGAQGLLPYCYHVYTKYEPERMAQGGWPWVLGGYLPDKQPQLWEALEQIGHELVTLAPALSRPSRMWQQDGLFLREIAPAGKDPGYLIAVNASEEKPVETVVRLQARLPRLHELEEIHRGTCCVKVAGNEVTLSLQPMQVGIYKLPAGL